MTQEQREMYRSVAASAIASGVAKIVVDPLKPIEINRLTNHNQRERQRRRRAKWVEMGLTSKGEIRTRGPRMSLTGWTPEQKRTRLLEQQKAWRNRQKEKQL